jgi:hypothetical protein
VSVTRQSPVLGSARRSQSSCSSSRFSAQRQHVVRPAGRKQRAGQPQAVRRDDVVVGQAVDQQQRAPQRRRVRDQ